MPPRKKTQEVIDTETLFDRGTAQTPPNQLRAVQMPEYAGESDPVDYDDVTALNNVLDELGDDAGNGAFVTVFREVSTPTGKQPDEYLERFAASEFSLDYLKTRWGAGKYKISVYRGGGAGLASRKVITIAKDPNVALPTTPAAQTTDLSPILAAIQESNKGVVSAILALAQNQQAQPTLADKLTEMKLMKEVFAPTSSVPSPPLDAVALLKLGAEMAGNGGGESNNAWVGKVLDQLGPVLMPALAGAIQSKPAVPVAPHVALPSPATAPAAAVQSADTLENPVNIIVAQYLNMLKRAAEQKAPVAEYADSILASIPPSVVGDIEIMLRPDDWREQLRKHTTAADQHPEWFGELRDTLLAYIEEDKAAAVEVSTSLTAAGPGASLASHENGDTNNSDHPDGHPGGTA